MKLLHVGLPLLCVFGLGAATSAAQQRGGAAMEIVQIDGSKNPEMIPQWSAWGFVFRVFAGGSRELPSAMIPHITASERALIMKEADSVQKIDAGCDARHRKIIEEKGGKKLEELDKEVRELSLECRWETLHARDRVLAGLSPDAQASLTAFVESTKTGTSLSIPKKDLARFREPE